MAQSITYRGFTVSSTAKEAGGKWCVTLCIEKDQSIVRKRQMFFSRCTPDQAQRNGTTHAMREIDALVQGQTVPRRG
ncbi:hypothetical protein [Noviherbaspirillum pedocola]|uniref:Uncharacterized protein n=1 Tax=Noviherbaspirillum pedocola TaxID=2801341 RepID=A0A934SVI1_9BURK|nr:hypothetical protein [Noviherbaspirillum pedocola]MBK4736113.1 hypothetical protein [Noviherbaspirillum pedocola]